MSDQDDYTALHATFSAIPEGEIKTSNMPIDEYIREAEKLFQRADTDFDELAKIGLKRHWVDGLSARTGALRKAQSNWLVAFKAKKDAKQLWQEELPKATGLRKSLMDACRFALRKEDEALKVVALIAKGNSYADTIQDISALATLGLDYQEQMTTIGWDKAALENAEQSADRLATLLAQADGNREEGNVDRVLRDQAFTLLKEAVDEIRDFGKYAFREQPTIQKQYSSRFIHRKNYNNSAGDDENGDSPDDNE